MWIPRGAEGRLTKLAGQRPVVVLTGARQTGKTSLVRRLFAKHHYVSLDLPSEAEQAERQPGDFLARHPPPVVIDEVQYAPGLFRHLKAVVDADRDRAGAFILTGSQRFPLMRAASESLAGRAAIVDLEGLTFAELRAAKIDVAPMELAVRGGLPELWQKPELDARDFYAAYVATYLERDLRALLAVASLRDFERFMRAVAFRSGGILNKADLASDVGIAGSTANAWLSVLEAGNQVFLLEPWFRNKTKSLVKSPKLYLGDSGLLCHFLGVGARSDVSVSPFAGAIWETFVCAELRRQVRDGRRQGDLFFWRDRAGEVDFLVHAGGRFDLFEAKAASHPAPRDFAQIRRVADILGDRAVGRMAVVCQTAHAFPLAPGVQAVPVSEL